MTGLIDEESHVINARRRSHRCSRKGKVPAGKQDVAPKKRQPSEQRARWEGVEARPCDLASGPIDRRQMMIDFAAWVNALSGGGDWES